MERTHAPACHSERREESHAMGTKIFAGAQNDIGPDAQNDNGQPLRPSSPEGWNISGSNDRKDRVHIDVAKQGC